MGLDPFLLENTARDVFDYSDLMRLKQELTKLGRYRQPIYEQVNQWMQETEEQKAAKGEAPIRPGEEVPFGASDFGKRFQMAKFLETLKPKEYMKRVICVLCGDLPQTACITDVRLVSNPLF
jgi:hypothetical protein